MVDITTRSAIPHSRPVQTAVVHAYPLERREEISRNALSSSMAERRRMPTVLIVEDDTNIRQFVAVNLRARGYAVVQAGSAEEGLRQLHAHAPGALVLDIKLPGMSGWDMLKQIVADPMLPDLPVIIMTASPLSDHAGEQTYSNIADRLVKPVSVADLMLAIRNACG